MPAWWTWLCRLAPILCVAGGTALAQPAPSGNATSIEARGLRPARLYGVASRNVFNSFNHNDVRAAIKVWFDLVAQQRGFVLDSRVDLVVSVAEIRERLRNHSVDLVTMGVTDYLELESTRLIVPVLTDARTLREEPFYSYVLVVRPTSGAATTANLRGKNILVYGRGSGLTATAWLDVLLGKEKLGRASSFFASIKAPDKAQACILPVFFGTVDACVVDEVSLNMAKEMNPQLGQLRALARSRPLIECVIAVPAEPHPYQKELIDTMLSLHEGPRGRQLLMVFQTDRLVRIRPGDLDSARELWRDYHRLPGPAAESEPAARGKGRY